LAPDVLLNIFINVGDKVALQSLGVGFGRSIKKFDVLLIEE
jgi:hypothetical protein